MEKIRKINVLYLLGYIFGPMVITAICFALSAAFFPKGNMAVILIMGPSFLSVGWWCFAGTYIFKQTRKKITARFAEENFKSDQTFFGRGCTVYVDEKQGKIGLVFFWNPKETYIIPASRVERAWVDDGKSGAGFLAGSSRVSFLFIVDGVKVRVDTFTSNQRWRMDSDYILTGISKADMMVEVINTAKGALSKEKTKEEKEDNKKSKEEKSNTTKKDSKTKSKKASK